LPVDRIEKMTDSLKECLCHHLSKATKVCTTADIWTAHNRSFIGCTVHWIDEASLQRKSAALACPRIFGRHTFDVVASALEEINVRFGISNKTVCTVTDNGSYFTKAFKEFSERIESSDNNIQTQAHQSLLQQNSDGDITFTSVEELLADGDSREESQTQYSLPPHHRCGAHTMNLVAVSDSDNACEDPGYKKISRSALAKCSALWNKSSRSPQAAETVMDMTKKTLIVPNATRWNSFYLAVEKIHSIAVQQSESNLNSLCEKLGLPVF
jgi:hypothetical protein